MLAWSMRHFRRRGFGVKDKLLPFDRICGTPTESPLGWQLHKLHGATQVIVLPYLMRHASCISQIHNGSQGYIQGNSRYSCPRSGYWVGAAPKFLHQKLPLRLQTTEKSTRLLTT